MLTNLSRRNSSSRSFHLVDMLNILIKLCDIYKFAIVQLLKKKNTISTMSIKAKINAFNLGLIMVDILFRRVGCGGYVIDWPVTLRVVNVW